MARKAVQGYTEKSLYDNTRYNGMITTYDVMNEGYFRHLVNFDIGDTNASLTSRKSFYTTALFKPGNSITQYINLSANTLVYKEGGVDNYIALDLESLKAYSIKPDINYLHKNGLLLVDTPNVNVDITEFVSTLIETFDDIKNVYQTEHVAKILNNYPIYGWEPSTEAAYINASNVAARATFDFQDYYCEEVETGVTLPNEEVIPGVTLPKMYDDCKRHIKCRDINPMLLSVAPHPNGYWYTESNDAELPSVMRVSQLIPGSMNLDKRLEQLITKKQLELTLAPVNASVPPAGPDLASSIFWYKDPNNYYSSFGIHASFFDDSSEVYQTFFGDPSIIIVDDNRTPVGEMIVDSEPTKSTMLAFIASLYSTGTERSWLTEQTRNLILYDIDQLCLCSRIWVKNITAETRYVYYVISVLTFTPIASNRFDVRFFDSSYWQVNIATGTTIINYNQALSTEASLFFDAHDVLRLAGDQTVVDDRDLPTNVLDITSIIGPQYNYNTLTYGEAPDNNTKVNPTLLVPMVRKWIVSHLREIVSAALQAQFFGEVSLTLRLPHNYNTWYMVVVPFDIISLFTENFTDFDVLRIQVPKAAIVGSDIVPFEVKTTLNNNPLTVTCTDIRNLNDLKAQLANKGVLEFNYTKSVTYNKYYRLMTKGDDVVLDLITPVSFLKPLTNYAYNITLNNYDARHVCCYARDFYAIASKRSSVAIFQHNLLQDLWDKYLSQHLTIKLLSSHEPSEIINTDGIRKRVVQVGVSLDDEDTHIYKCLPLELTYSSKAVQDILSNYNYPKNTLMVSLVNLNQHPTYVSNERNIANPKSLLPSALQHIHTLNTRPSGHVSSLFPALFIKDDSSNHYLNHVYNSRKHVIYPIFSMDPAAYNLFDEEERAKCYWAYRFDIINTSANGSLKTVSTPWSFINEQGASEIVFKNSLDALQNNLDIKSIDLFNNVAGLRHYLGARFLIYIVPKDPTYNSISLAEKWDSALSKRVTTKNELEDLILELESSALFYLVDITDVDKYNDNIQTPMSFKDLRMLTQTLDGTEYTNVLKNDDPALTMADISSNKFMSHSLSDDDISYMASRCLYKTYRAPTVAYGADLLTGAGLRQKIYSAGIFSKYQLVFRALPKVVSSTIETFAYERAEVSDHSVEGYIKKNIYESIYSSELPYFDRYFGWRFFNNTEYLTEPVNKYAEVVDMSMLPTQIQDTSGNNIIGLRTENLRSFNQNILTNEGFFTNGYSVIFYMKPFKMSDVTKLNTTAKAQSMIDAWSTTPFVSSLNVAYGYDNLTVTKLPIIQDEDALNIQSATDSIVFNQDTLVIWFKNNLYISEPGDYYYFKADSKHTFSENIVKVIQFKTILLVFTTQHLYAVYQTILEMPGPTSYDSEGKAIATTTEITYWTKQTVLYNLFPSYKYADAIQVFNQMVLFYSEDGQLFLIKPSQQIDSETRFTIQYLNKACNDILLNYPKYINERLKHYDSPRKVVADDVTIKVKSDINTIKIFYSVPGLITYILIYDILLNRYTAYDTMSYSNPVILNHGEWYVTKPLISDGVTATTVFTFVKPFENDIDQRRDLSVLNNFQIEPIQCLIDTGTLNLNNHLRKRFKDVLVTLKNLSSSRLAYQVIPYIDDVKIDPVYGDQIQIQESFGTPYLVSVQAPTPTNILTSALSEESEQDMNFLFRVDASRNDNLLFSLDGYNSSKMISHSTSIASVGRTLRLELKFTSKGAYKIQSFGIIYKERRV